MKKGWMALLVLTLSLPGISQKLDSAQQAVKKVYVDFVKWYRNNAQKLDPANLVGGSDTTENGMQPPYHFIKRNVDKYFANMRKRAPWLGETFIANEKKFFKSCEKYWKKYPQEEIIYGFDYDRFIGGQESPDVVVDGYILARDVIWKVDINGNGATIYYMNKGARDENNKPLKFKDATRVKMKKENGLWKIALLQNDVLKD